jgi:hypothetical protein
MESSVGILALRVGASRVCSLPDIRSAAEDFAQRVLRRCDEIIEESAPGRVLLMRRLQMSWRMLERALNHDGEIAAFSNEVATALEREARGAYVPPSTDRNVIVFSDGAEWRAAWIEAWARGQADGVWYFEPLTSEGDPIDLFRAGREEPTAETLLLRLLKRGTLLEVMDAMPAEAVRSIAESFGIVDAGNLWRQSERITLPAEIVSFLDGRSGAIAGRSADRSEKDHSTITALQTSREFEDSLGASPRIGGLETGFGGLFYLIHLVLELGIGESLWKACLPEREILARIATAILGTDVTADPAPELFGGAPSNSPLPLVSADQQAEITVLLLNELIATLPRRGLAPLPQVVLGFVRAGSGRLLAAAMAGSPFAIFAWPAADAASTQAGLEAFMASWPHTAPAPLGAPGLAGIDRKARIRAIRGADISGLLLPEADNLAAAALLTQSVGSLCHLFAARAKAFDIETSADLVDRFLAIPARVELSPDTMTIRMPMDRIDPALRSAALDADPGWVPWLNKTVRFEFVE